MCVRTLFEDAACEIAEDRGFCCGYNAESDLDLKCAVLKHEVLRRSFFFECALARVRELCDDASSLVHFAEHATGPTLGDDAVREETAPALAPRQPEIAFNSKRVASATPQTVTKTRKRNNNATTPTPVDDDETSPLA